MIDLTDAAAEELRAPRAFSVFTGSVESDPDRVGFWLIQVSSDGLTIEPAQVPDAPRECEPVSWADLYDVLRVREDLAEDLAHLQEEVQRTEWVLAGLRGAVRRKEATLKRLAGQYCEQCQTVTRGERCATCTNDAAPREGAAHE